ncbi:MAG: hypothetical protein IAC13_09290 [Firmicutes bacterium]|uniref:Uncharacterized protein n=1 Tax=Candidatus Scybalomonas excrementavium TaxID=2840943 RepID=A0A9D9I314_9FIRM|nr:hypothetical protein [Candidatus Scybalomonas excrementavium]
MGNSDNKGILSREIEVVVKEETNLLNENGIPVFLAKRNDVFRIYYGKTKKIGSFDEQYYVVKGRTSTEKEYLKEGTFYEKNFAIYKEESPFLEEMSLARKKAYLDIENGIALKIQKGKMKDQKIPKQEFLQIVGNAVESYVEPYIQRSYMGREVKRGVSVDKTNELDYVILPKIESETVVVYSVKLSPNAFDPKRDEEMWKSIRVQQDWKTYKEWNYEIKGISPEFFGFTRETFLDEVYPEWRSIIK